MGRGASGDSFEGPLRGARVREEQGGPRRGAAGLGVPGLGARRLGRGCSGRIPPTTTQSAARPAGSVPGAVPVRFPRPASGAGNLRLPRGKHAGRAPVGPKAITRPQAPTPLAFGLSAPPRATLPPCRRRRRRLSGDRRTALPEGPDRGHGTCRDHGAVRRHHAAPAPASPPPHRPVRASAHQPCRALRCHGRRSPAHRPWNDRGPPALSQVGRGSGWAILGSNQ